MERIVFAFVLVCVGGPQLINIYSGEGVRLFPERQSASPGPDPGQNFGPNHPHLSRPILQGLLPHLRSLPSASERGDGREAAHLEPLPCDKAATGAGAAGLPPESGQREQLPPPSALARRRSRKKHQERTTAAATVVAISPEQKAAAVGPAAPVHPF
eukprot:CAMPEP_0114515708 /NCGR_PEP_ID=MMETSP0109-20121206/16900_1 /TAXON_ID=29199 /ORGANISM="Chlorarachnion reptans, Strain CCCM449" /LENGTH=156 /DNA_ID=CAMNT_0001695971 /DNA_START=360 /DNA_END=831 /DNA_ORIENTATION=+